MAVTDPDAPPYKRLSTFIVPTDAPGVNIVRSVGVGQEANGTPRLRALSGRPRAKGPSAGTARRRVRGCADAARRRTDSSRDAHYRTGPQSLRPDVRAGALAHDAGLALGRQADGAGEDRGFVDRHRAVPPAGAAHRVAHRQVQGLSQGAQGHRRREGADAEGVPRCRSARAADSRLARRNDRRCRSSSR